MLRQGRKPRNQSEQMIHNNFAAMQFIRAHQHLPFTPELILQLQLIMTDLTLQDSTAAGRWRRPEENVRVVDERNHEVLYVPPSAEEIASRIIELCHFANDANQNPFIHPLIEAVAIHFMLGWVHPFVDKNAPRGVWRAAIMIASANCESRKQAILLAALRSDFYYLVQCLARKCISLLRHLLPRVRLCATRAPVK